MKCFLDAFAFATFEVTVITHMRNAAPFQVLAEFDERLDQGEVDDAASNTAGLLARLPMCYDAFNVIQFLV